MKYSAIIQSLCAEKVRNLLLVMLSVNGTGQWEDKYAQMTRMNLILESKATEHKPELKIKRSN